MKNFLKIVSVYVGAFFFFFFLAQRACVAYIWLLFKYAFICIPNTGRHQNCLSHMKNTSLFVYPIWKIHYYLFIPYEKYIIICLSHMKNTFLFVYPIWKIHFYLFIPYEKYIFICLSHMKNTLLFADFI